METRRLRSGLRSTPRIAAALVAGLAVASPAAASAQGERSSAARTSCPGADTASRNIRKLKKATLCLHNAKRRAHGLSKLSWNRDLTRVAAKYSRTMARDHFFSHYSAGHRDHMDRIAASGYRPSAGCWTAGENLFFSAGGTTPRRLFRAWMKSTIHRQTVLRDGWEDFGLGVTKKSPDGSTGGLTVVALFGVRTKSC
jgi:uncharacterized protein YkwD